MYAAAAAIICAICWYFRTALIYVILAAVLSLIGRPIMRFLTKIKIKGHKAPDWLLAIFTIIIILTLFVALVTQVVPVIYNIVSDISSNIQEASLNSKGLALSFDKINLWIRQTFPGIERGFKIQDWAVGIIKDTFSISSISSVIGSVASTIGNLAIGIFSVVFISFFFIKDRELFARIVCALVPDRLEQRTKDAISNMEVLLSRYFVGLIIEVLCVSTIDFLGLWLVARLGFSTSIGIAFMAGLLNIIPYVGPWIGAAIGTSLGLVLKFSSAAAAGGSLDIWAVLLILVAIFICGQFVDNILLQPLIYSTSIKSSPLEIFIVMLLAGHIGGMVGMLVAIPAYTVIRVIAGEFFGNVKAVKKLIGN